MNMKPIVAVAIALTVGIVTFSGVLIPAIESGVTTEDTYTNDGWFRMSQYDTTTDHTISWTYEKPNVITVDSEDVVINYNIAGGQCTVVANSVWLLRYNVDSTGNPLSVAFLYGTSGTKIASVEDHQTATLTLTGGSASVSVGTYTGTHSYDVVYVPDNDGAFTMKKSDKLAYVHGDSPIYGFGLTRVRNSTGIVGSPGVGFVFSGSYDDGITGAVWRVGDANTVTDCVCVATKDNSHEDLYKFDKITAVSTLTETIDEQTVTTNTDLVYNMVIVPYEVTAERTVHADASTILLFQTIPVFIVLGMIVAVVGVLYLKSRR